MKAFWLTLLLLYSCTDSAKVSRDSLGVHIGPLKMRLSHLNEIEWNVGIRKENTITQSFTFIVDMPKIREEDLEYIMQTKGVDAWIVRLVVSRGSEVQDLGSLYALFKPRKMSRVSSASSATSSVTLKVFYAAAYASERFRAFRCPAFSHNKKIHAMDIEGSNEELTLGLGQASPYGEKSQLVELAPSAFNGGNSLVGEYFVEIAAYDSKSKMIHSSFKRLPMHVSVKGEDSIELKTCLGVHPEIAP